MPDILQIFKAAIYTFLLTDKKILPVDTIQFVKRDVAYTRLRGAILIETKIRRSKMESQAEM